MRDLRLFDDRAVGDDRLLELAVGEFRKRQVPGAAEEMPVFVIEVERRLVLGEGDVFLVERGDGTDVAPVAAVDEGIRLLRRHCLGDDLAAEIEFGVVFEQVDHHVFVEEVNAHGGQEFLFAVFDDRQVGDLVFFLRLFHEFPDLLVFGHAHDPQVRSTFYSDEVAGNGHLGAFFLMEVHHVHQVHLVKLVAREDHDVLDARVGEVLEGFAHGVSRALEPVAEFHGLLCRGDLHEALGKVIEFVRAEDVAVKRRGIELGQDQDAVQAGIKAVADGDVDQAVLSGNRHRGFGAVFG